VPSTPCAFLSCAYTGVRYVAVNFGLPFSKIIENEYLQLVSITKIYEFQDPLALEYPFAFDLY
jgi:hypothetical protein